MWPLRVVDFLLLKAGLSTGLANRTSIPTSRFLMSTDVIAHILRLSEPKVVMASCSHGTNPGTAHTDVHWVTAYQSSTPFACMNAATDRFALRDVLVEPPKRA
jgi:hypothetical protein